jgi:hypothetical protein
MRRGTDWSLRGSAAFPCGETKLWASPLGDAEPGTDQERAGGEADSEPACLGVVLDGERAQRLDGDVGGEQEEAERDELLCAPLGGQGVDARAGEAPDDDEAGESLDCRTWIVLTGEECQRAVETRAVLAQP